MSNPEALRGWPVVLDENGKLAKPPADSKHHGARSAPRSKGVPNKHRRTTAELVAQVRELRGRGLFSLQFADSLNLSDRRVKQIIARAPA